MGTSHPTTVNKYLSTKPRQLTIDTHYWTFILIDFNYQQLYPCSSNDDLRANFSAHLKQSPFLVYSQTTTHSLIAFEMENLLCTVQIFLPFVSPFFIQPIWADGKGSNQPSTLLPDHHSHPLLLLQWLQFLTQPFLSWILGWNNVRSGSMTWILPNLNWGSPIFPLMPGPWHPSKTQPLSTSPY